MPKQEGQKTKLLALLHIFEQKTDENHLLNVPQLVELLEQQGILAERKSIYSDIDTYMDETISKFVVGDLSLDQFDSFVQQLKDMGIEDCIAIEQTAYDRYLEA